MSYREMDETMVDRIGDRAAVVGVIVQVFGYIQGFDALPVKLKADLVAAGIAIYAIGHDVGPDEELTRTRRVA